ncbi:MAG: ISAs1 family transposase [Clostridiaceae bacterium]|jgi:hypothetical protein|nr:ISAs1 family transposase [Clostridiaceae bacterium]
MLSINGTQKGKQSIETRYYLSNITNGTDYSNCVRQHWGIESMHWLLDVIFKEDKSCIRKENEPENAALLRKISLNVLKIDTKFDKENGVRPYSYKCKRYKAALDTKCIHGCFRYSNGSI